MRDGIKKNNWRVRFLGPGHGWEQFVVSVVSGFALARMREIACSTCGALPKHLKFCVSSNIFNTKKIFQDRPWVQKANRRNVHIKKLKLVEAEDSQDVFGILKVSTVLLMCNILSVTARSIPLYTILVHTNLVPLKKFYTYTMYFHIQMVRDPDRGSLSSNLTFLTTVSKKVAKPYG